jgi:hypothetical protein
VQRAEALKVRIKIFGKKKNRNREKGVHGGTEKQTEKETKNDGEYK